MYHENQKLFKLERVLLLCLNNHFIILLNINTFYAFFLQKIKTYYLCLILTSFLDCVIREILGSVLKPPFLCKCCSAIRREEVCKQVGCERERLTLYINNTNFPLINMQQLKHIIFQDLLNEPRIMDLLLAPPSPGHKSLWYTVRLRILMHNRPLSSPPTVTTFLSPEYGL